MAEAKGKEGIQFRLKCTAEGAEPPRGRKQKLSSLAGPVFTFENRGPEGTLGSTLLHGCPHNCKKKSKSRKYPKN